MRVRRPTWSHLLLGARRRQAYGHASPCIAACSRSRRRGIRLERAYALTHIPCRLKLGCEGIEARAVVLKHCESHERRPSDAVILLPASIHEVRGQKGERPVTGEHARDVRCGRRQGRAVNGAGEVVQHGE